MDEKELRELLRARLHMELQLFKDFMFQKEKVDIFKSSYRIEIYVNLYEILPLSLRRPFHLISFPCFLSFLF